MTHSHDLFESLFHNSTHISIEISSQIPILRLGIISWQRVFKDILYVPNILDNVLSFYQIYHTSDGKIVEFSPHNVVIWELHHPDSIVASKK